MILFVASVTIVITVSAFCSLSEASLYAVRIPFIRKLVEQGSAAGRLLLGFKQDIQQPIAAILILNTIANTAGAAVAGAQARQLFGQGALVWFTILFTGTVLVFSEILPKVVGVTFNRVVAPAVSMPLKAALGLLYPLVWLTESVTGLVRGQPQPIAPEDEVQQFAQMSAEEGSILPMEAELVSNVLRLNDILAKDILTPRVVVFKLPADRTVGEVREQVSSLPIARIPVFREADPENWIGVVLLRDILRCIAQDDFSVTLDSLAKPLHFVPESARGHALLTSFLVKRAHLFGVVDEFGAVAGVITLEDVLESLLGKEIVDETDTTVDLRDAARKRREELLRGHSDDS